MRLFVVCSTALCVGVLAAACSSPTPAPAAPPVQKLWGDLKPVVSVKELMRDMIGIHADRSRKLGMEAR